MNRHDYLTTQAALAEIGGRLLDVDLEGFLAMARDSLDAAPFIDPTLYRLAGAALEQVIGLAQAANRMQAVARDIGRETLQVWQPLPAIPNAQDLARKDDHETESAKSHPALGEHDRPRPKDD